MKLEDLVPIGTYFNMDTGVKVVGYDQGCVILESVTGRGIRVVAAHAFLDRYAAKVGTYSDGYLKENHNG